VTARLLELGVRVPREAWMCVLCVVSKGKMQSTREQKKNPPRPRMFVLRVV
jgi:hypothetical protein